MHYAFRKKIRMANIYRKDNDVWDICIKDWDVWARTQVWEIFNNQKKKKIQINNTNLKKILKNSNKSRHALTNSTRNGFLGTKFKVSHAVLMSQVWLSLVVLKNLSMLFSKNRFLLWTPRFWTRQNRLFELFLQNILCSNDRQTNAQH